MNDLIKIENFDNENASVYFKYLGDEPRKVKVRISSKNLTLHFVELELLNDVNVTYFVGVHNSVIDRVKKIQIDFWDEYFRTTKEFIIDNIEGDSSSHFFESNIEDPAYYTYDEVFNKNIY